MKATKEEIIDFLTELSDLRTQSRNPYYLQQRALMLLKSINSLAGNETPTVTDNEHQGKDLLLQDNDIDIVGNCANCGIEFHIHKSKSD